MRHSTRFAYMATNFLIWKKEYPQWMLYACWKANIGRRWVWFYEKCYGGE